MTAMFPLPRFTSTRDDVTARAARVSRGAPRIPWEVFAAKHFVWEPGEHVAMIGPTGQGKTNQLLNILPLHPYVVVFATKPRDESMELLIQSGGYVRLDKWKSMDPRQTPRRVLWPSAMSLDSEKTQHEVFKNAFDRIYREGGWTVAIDELWYIINILGLDREVKTYLLQARALGISLVCATQRPVSVPLEVYDQSTHLFFFRDNDRRNIDRLADIHASNTPLIRELVANLDRHQVLYVNTRTGFMCRTKAPLATVGR